MAKTRAPLLSIEATGSLAHAITMSKSRGRSYTKHYRRPRDPQSELQLARRAWFRGLATAWPTTPAADKATWSNCPRNQSLSDYNAYLQYNLARIDRGLFPSARYPFAGIGLVGALGSPAMLPGPRHIQSTWQYADVRENWLCVLHRSLTTGFTPSHTNVVTVLLKRDLLPFTIMHAPLEPDTYYYRKRSIALDGYTYLWSAEYSATVPTS